MLTVQVCYIAKSVTTSSMRSALSLSFLATLSSAHVFEPAACSGTYTYSVTATEWIMPDGSKSTEAPIAPKPSWTPYNKPAIVPSSSASPLPSWDDKWYKHESGKDGKGSYVYEGPSKYMKDGKEVDTWQQLDSTQMAGIMVFNSSHAPPARYRAVLLHTSRRNMRQRLRLHLLVFTMESQANQRRPSQRGTTTKGLQRTRVRMTPTQYQHLRQRSRVRNMDMGVLSHQCPRGTTQHRRLHMLRACPVFLVRSSANPPLWQRAPARLPHILLAPRSRHEAVLLQLHPTHLAASRPVR